MFKNALVSVSDKTGLVDFLKPFVAGGLRVLSTGGTLKHLRENGIAAIEVSEQTGFPEVMDGRVKTLHPRIHMALLARSENAEDQALLKKEALQAFDLVVVNLYPFESARAKGVEGDELIEYIDIGGPSMLRSAAKSHERIAVVCDPGDYRWIAAKGELNLADRRKLAARVYAHTSQYDDLIAKTLSEDADAPTTLVGRPVAELRYGENPHQKASWLRDPSASFGLHEAEILHGKPLSYNNLLDLDASTASVSDFEEPCAVAVKHNNPCGVGTDSSIASAVQRALEADPVSVFGGIIALNRPVDLACAEAMAKIFLECIIAPDFAPDALERLKKKKDLRLLKWPHIAKRRETKEFRSVTGGFLVQDADRVQAKSNDWKILGEQPSASQWRDLSLAWRVCARLKSNAIAIAAGGRTVGLGMGQVNRVEAVEHAISRMRQHHAQTKDAVLASDAFFPFADSIEKIADAGIRWVIQPGGSIRDEEVIAKAKERGVNLILTGTRHFRH
ncbi:MAG: bifunctional phosphoribosylaminoimidazolecarboxamide formyltransferase/IMP cyclohydrolase [Bdellovibrionota bacterium]